jgi:hypothetical protein
MPTEDSFIKGMYKLANGWPDHDLPVATIELYKEKLSSLTDEDFEKAVNRCIDTCRYFPKIRELLKAADVGKSTASCC